MTLGTLLPDVQRHAGTSPVESILSPRISGKLELSLADKRLTPQEIRTRVCATESWLHTFMQTESSPSTPRPLRRARLLSLRRALLSTWNTCNMLFQHGGHLYVQGVTNVEKKKKGHLERKFSAGTAADGLGGSKSCAALLRKTSLSVFSSESRPELL